MYGIMVKNKHSNSLYIVYLLSILLSACSYEKRQPEASVVFDSLSTGRLLVSGMMINGRKYGVWNTYYESGQIKSISTYVNDTLNGPWVFYRDEGNISSKGQYKDDQEDGEWLLYYWYPSNVATKRYFSNGKKVGVWEEYYDSGRLKLRVEYDENEKEKVLVDNTIPLPDNPE
jgi:antitoxin component YwqK of YwqJK toxin-antitoxin module